MAQLTVGLIGAGGISHAHAPSWRALGHDVVVYAEKGASELAEAYGLTLAGSLDELLGSVDVVDICTPTPTHAELALAAIAAGLDVICEKPIARTAADARRVADAATERGVSVFPAHVVRYFPEYAALHAAVQAGRLGELAILRFSRGGAAPSADWFFDEAAAGGLVLDQMIHDLDQARWIAGEVVAVMATQNPPTVDGVSPRIAVAHVTLTHASGALSHVQGSWGPAGVEFVTSFDAAGSSGRLQYDSRARREITSNVPPRAGSTSYLPTLSGDNPYASELREFVAAIEGGPAPRVTINDGILAIGLAEAALDSVRTGQTVPFDELLILTGVAA